MADTWEAGKDIWEVVQDLISKHHPMLAMVDKEIAIIFKEKASKTGGQVVLGKSSRAPGVLKLLGKAEYKFIIEIAGDEWTTLADNQRLALLDHLLCACNVEEDPKTGEPKCSIKSPEVSFFWKELERNGDWRTRPEQSESGAMDVESVIDIANSPPAKS